MDAEESRKSVLYWADYAHHDQNFTLIASSRGLSFLALPYHRQESVADFFRRHSAFRPEHSVSRMATYLEQLDQYFSGQRQAFALELDVLSGTLFQRRVWRSLEQIPYGQTWSYADVARAAGYPKAYRAVGRAVGKNPIAVVIPCHRVIGSDGSLTGFGGGLDLKAQLLRLEGVSQVNPKAHA